MSLPRRIVVDLQLLLPGGQNGGSKVLVLELLAELFRLAPHYEWVLVTSPACHDELGQFERLSVTRVCAPLPGQQPAPSPASRSPWTRLSGWLLRTLSWKLGNIPPGTQPSDKGLPQFELESIDLFFCPFAQFGFPSFYNAAVPLVSVIYDQQYHFFPDFFHPADLEARRRSLHRTVETSHRVICISNFVRQTLLETTTAPPDRAITIYPGLTRRLTPPTAAGVETTLRRLGLREERFLFYPANYWRHKNHRTLLDAFASARARLGDTTTKLVFTGSPTERHEDVRAYCAQLGLAESVVFAGYLPEEDLAALFHSCRALVFPSLYEGFGIPIAEAMTFGKPVLCSNTTSLPEVAGDAAIYFDPSDPDALATTLCQILTDDDLARRLGAAGLERADRFTDATQMAHEYLGAFEDLLAQGGAFRDTVTGVFEDGWTTDCLTVTYAPGHDATALTLRLFAPAWVSPDPVTVSITHGPTRGTPPQEVTLPRGAPQDIRVPLPRTSGWIRFSISPVFSPHALGKGNDTRRLGVRVQLCALETPAGSWDLLGATLSATPA